MNTFYAGANSEAGFVNLFAEILESYSHCYILKGGSGCGKSSFMKKLAAEGESNGETVKRIYCASDPESLDGVLLPERSVAIVDGTAPHISEAKNVGANDITVDLGEYLDAKYLRSHADEIGALARQKSTLYKQSYTLLSAAGSVRRTAWSILSPAVKQEKLLASAGRFARGHGKADKVDRLYLKAFNAGGITSATGGEGVAFYDRYGVSDVFFRELASICGGTVVPHPIYSELFDGIVLPDGVCVCRTDTKTDGCINGERFVDRGEIAKIRSSLRFLEKMQRGLVESARELIAKARECHGRLEKIYLPSVDFGKVDERLEKVKKDIFS